MNIEEVQKILEEVKHLRGAIDNFYDVVNQSNYKLLSDMYMDIDNQINKLQGMIMSLAIKEVDK